MRDYLRAGGGTVLDDEEADEISKALGLRGLFVGNHEPLNSDSRSGSVGMIWLCSVQPSFEPGEAIIACVRRGDGSRQLLFRESGLRCSEIVLLALGPSDAEPDFVDAALAKIRLPFTDGNLVLDGIAYLFSRADFGSDLFIRCASPEREDLRGLFGAVRRTLGSLAAKTDNAEAKSYCAVWDEYESGDDWPGGADAGPGDPKATRVRPRRSRSKPALK